MIERTCLILTQYREAGEYNDFLGKYYHFPATKSKSYLKQFDTSPIEVVYFEPQKQGEGVFYGYGRITKPPFPDRRESDHYYVEISEYKPFTRPVFFKNEKNEILETLFNSKNYNPQNAVRRIEPSFLDSLCLDGGIQLNFRADAHLIKVLGEQLIGSEKVGVLELIKNSIDASATYCRVRIEKVSALEEVDDSEYEFGEYEGPVIVIEDDGSGMDRSVIENGWLRPASTLKTNIKERLKIEKKKAQDAGKLGVYNTLVKQLKKEHNGRIPLGEKGVGRFATHRLGRQLIIKTKVRGADYENILKIDWDRFDRPEIVGVDLDTIGIELTRQKISRDYGEKDSGTQIIISGGREGFTWDAEKIEDINESILRLNSPNPNPQNIVAPFQAFLECPQYPDLNREQLFERYNPNFSLQALVNADGIVDEYSITFSPPTTLDAPISKQEWSDRNYDLKLASSYWKDSDGNTRNPTCGAFFINISAWYRRKDWISGPDYKGLLNYLHEYGGISIYRDNLLISSAEDGTRNDWLGLSLRNIKQGFRISYYNMIGNIEIEQTENLDLVDKTNREGMVENRSYLDLAELVETIIQNLLEIQYIAKRDEYSNLTKGLIRDPKQLGGVTSQNSKVLEGVINNYSLARDPWQILDELGETSEERKAGLINLNISIKNLKRSIDVIEEVQERLTEHAGFGIAAAVSLHEITKITSNFYTGISHLLKSKKYDSFKLEDLKAASLSLKSELKRLSPLRAVRNENRRDFNILQSVRYAYEIFKIKLEKEHIEFEVNEADDFPVYARYSTLNQVLANLLDNSIYWIRMSGKKKGKIQMNLDHKYRTLIVADSGTNIDPLIRPYLFEPGYSMKIPPSGLGLYICKSFMNSMEGNIHETSTRERIGDMNGAQFTLEFERVPKSKEFAK